MIGAWILVATATVAVQAADPQEADSSQEAAPVEGPLLDTATTYAAYHGDVSEAGVREINSGMALDATMDALAGYYNDDRLVDAQIAYAALVASQHPEFIDSVRAVADYYGVEVATRGLLDNPAYVTGFDGADQASDAVVASVGEDVGQMNAVGNRYRQAAYNLQNEGWANTRARDRDDRIASLEDASSEASIEIDLSTHITSTGTRSASSLFDREVAVDNTGAVSLDDLNLTVGEQQMEPDERRVGQMLAVAALQSIESGDMSVMDQMLSNRTVERCIAWARLDLQQCVAAGHFKYEDAFCIAEHALDDVAECLTTQRATN